jgi:nitrous oxidase accessory protein NosD
MNARILAAFACAGAALALAGGAGAAGSTERHVSTRGTDAGDCHNRPCRTINYAVAQASPGDKIEVERGTYTESVLVTKRLNLDSHGATIDAAGYDNGVVISGPAAAGTRLEDFTVMHAKLEGVLAMQTSGLRIEENKILQNDLLWDPVNVPEPCQSSDDCGEALHLLSVTDSRIQENLVQQNVGGILLTDELGPTARNTIIDNRVLDNTKDCGITLASHFFSKTGPVTAAQGGVYDNLVRDNVSSRNGAAGIGIFAGPPGAAAYRNLVIHNVATDNGLPGVAIHSHTPGQYVNDNAIVANRLARNGADDDAMTGAPTGISIWSAVVPIPNTIVANNEISHEYYGIFARKAVSLPGLRSNRFHDVTVPVSTG